MVNSLLGNVPFNVLYRLDVNFNIEETNLDSYIGRTAHILFLENEDLLRMIVARYKIIFNWLINLFKQIITHLKTFYNQK